MGERAFDFEFEFSVFKDFKLISLFFDQTTDPPLVRRSDSPAWPSDTGA